MQLVRLRIHIHTFFKNYVLYEVFGVQLLDFAGSNELIEIFTYSFKNIQAMNWKRNDWKHSYIPFQKEVCVLCAIRIIISSTHMQGSSVLKSHMHWNTHHHFHPSSHTHCCTYPVITRPPGMALPALCLTSGVNSTPLTPLSNIITHTALCWVQRTGAFIAPGLLAFTC